MGKLLIHIKQRLYIYVAIDFIIALLTGYFINLSKVNIKPVSIAAVFIMLYPMLTGLEVEKVKKASRNLKLILSTLIFAFFIASGTAFLISRTILSGYPDIALAMVMVGAIPCSNMLIGWTGIADASLEGALVIAVIGLILLPFLSPLIIKISGNAFTPINLSALILTLLSYIIIPFLLGMYTRHRIIKKRGRDYFVSIKKYLPGISAMGILIIVFISVTKVSPIVITHPMIFLIVLGGLLSYYIIQTLLSLIAAKLLKLKYENGIILILGATASSQAISLSIAATMFSNLTVFALSFKPMLQVAYIMFLIYGLGPWVKKFLGTEKN